MEINKLIETINKIIDREASCTVGMLCAKIETLEHNKSLSPALFKDLAKNTVYEQSRALKKLLMCITIPKIVFVTGKDK